MARPFTQAQRWASGAILPCHTSPHRRSLSAKNASCRLCRRIPTCLSSPLQEPWFFHHRRQAPAREPAVANMTPLSSETRPCASAPCSWGGCASLRCGSFWPPALPACRRQYDVPLIRNATLRVRPLLLGRMRIAPARQLLAAGTAGTARLTFHAFAAKSSAENHIFQPFLPENSLSKPLRRVYNG